MNDKLQAESSDLIKKEMSDNHRINVGYRRLRYIGEPVHYDQILKFSTDLDKYPLYCKEREMIIE